MQRSTPKIAMVSRMIGPFAATVHGLPGCPSPEILTNTFAFCASSVHRRAPARQACRCPVRGQPGVIENDRRARKIACQIASGVEMPPGGLQIEGQRPRFEQCKSTSPARCRPSIPAALRFARSGPAAARGLWRIPRTIGVRCLLGQHVTDPSSIEPCLRDAGRRQAMFQPELLQPASLADRIARIPFRLDVDRHRDAIASPRRVGSRPAGSSCGSRCSRRSETQSARWSQSHG